MATMTLTIGSSGARSNDEEKRWAELSAAGLVALRTEKKLRSREPVQIAGEPVSQTIVEDREDRF